MSGPHSFLESGHESPILLNRQVSIEISLMYSRVRCGLLTAFGFIDLEPRLDIESKRQADQTKFLGNVTDEQQRRYEKGPRE